MLPDAISSPTCEYAAMIALLTFALKRLCAIDLELRAHREEQWARLRAARARRLSFDRDGGDIDADRQQ
jgi:hypothetical protein